MSKLVWTNLSMDGMRDVMNNSGAVDASTYQDYRPRTNGTTVNTHGTSNTATSHFRDWANSYEITGGDTTYNLESQIIKETITNTVYIKGWGTVGGMEGMTNNGTTTQIGSLDDGDTSYTTSALALSSSNAKPNGSDFDSNKWLSGAAFQLLDGVVDTYTFKIAFEGSGCDTGDTDWSNVYVKGHAASGDDGVGYKFARSVGLPTFYYSRLVYQWSWSSAGGGTGPSALIDGNFTVSFD